MTTQPIPTLNSEVRVTRLPGIWTVTAIDLAKRRCVVSPVSLPVSVRNRSFGAQWTSFGNVHPVKSN